MICAFGREAHGGVLRNWYSFICRLFPIQKLEFGSGLQEWAETARIHSSGSAAGVGEMAEHGLLASCLQGPREPLAGGLTGGALSLNKAVNAKTRPP